MNYIVIYLYTKHGGTHGMGNIEYVCNTSFCQTEDEIREVERQIRECDGYESCVILKVIQLGEAYYKRRWE